MTASLRQARALATAADHQLAATLAERAGALLLALRASGGHDPDVLRKEGDRRSHELLAAELAAHRPGDAVLSEEGKDSTRRLGARRVWIVDPLDGTREFGEPPRVDWAVHVALVIGGFPVVGAVALPALDEVWSTAAGPVPAAPRNTAAPPRLAVSRTRLGWSAGLVEQALAAELVPMGSAGFKAQPAPAPLKAREVHPC